MEFKLIGHLIINKERYAKDIFMEISPKMFNSRFCRDAYVECQKADALDMPMDLNYLATVLKGRHSESEINTFINNVYDACMDDYAYDVKASIESIKLAYKRRVLEKMATSIPGSLKSNSVEDVLNKTYLWFEEIYSNQDNGRISKLGELVEKFKDDYFKDKETIAIPTFEKLDKLAPIRKGELILIGARPAVGKSAFSAQIAYYASNHGKNIGFFNLEMTEEQMYERFIALESGIPLERIINGVRFLGDEESKYIQANEKISQSGLNIITGSKTVQQIKQIAKCYKFDCIIIDYMQLISIPESRESRYVAVGKVSNELKQLALSLKIPVILLSQLNRESVKSREPMMSELRESGSLEQDADKIFLLWNVTEDRKWKALKIDKNRQGAAGVTIVYQFNGERMQFIETNENVKDVEKCERGNDSVPDFE